MSSSASPMCGEGSYQSIDRLVLALSADVRAAFPRAYRGVGCRGIFSSRGASSGFDYNNTKGVFMHERLCQLSSRLRAAASNASAPLTLCEVGFNAGHTSMLLLQATGNSRVLTFDLGDYPWAKWTAQLLKEVYGDRFEATFGSSGQTVPAFHRARPAEVCDIVYIDGAKDYQLRLDDIKHFREMARAGAPLIFDEVCTRSCIVGSGDCSKEAQPGCLWVEATAAVSDAVKQGLLLVEDCAWPKSYEGTDGICVGRFT